MAAKLQRGELSRKQAEREILAILDRVPDSQLPKPDRVEDRNENSWAWYGGRGWAVRPTSGAADRNRRFDLIDAFEMEWLRRERARRFGPHWEFLDGKPIGGVS